MEHSVSPDFRTVAGNEAKFNKLYPQIKRNVSRNLTPGSVFACYDRYSKRLIYNLIFEIRSCHRPFYRLLRKSSLLVQNHAERNENKHPNENLDVDLITSNGKDYIIIYQKFSNTSPSNLRYASVPKPPSTVLERNFHNRVNQRDSTNSN